LPDEDAIKPAEPTGLMRRRTYQHEHDGGPNLSRRKSVEHAAVSLFVLGKTEIGLPRRSISSARGADLPYLSNQVTVGRNSSFHRLSTQDRERLGGIEYRALKLLLKIVSGTTSTRCRAC